MLNRSHWGVFETTPEVWAGWGNLGFVFHAPLFFLGTSEFLRNVFQDDWKNFTSVRNLILPDKFRADCIGWFYFFHFCSKFENSRGHDAWKDSAEFFSTKLWKNSSQFQKFHPVQEIVKVESFFNFAKKFGDSGKILMLENFGHLGNFYATGSVGPLTKVEESFNLYTNILGTLEKS